MHGQRGGAGGVSHAGVGMLREMAEYTGLSAGVTAGLLDTYRGMPFHPPGRVFVMSRRRSRRGARGQRDRGVA